MCCIIYLKWKIGGKTMIEGWRYYNHAAIPTCAPDETPDISPIENGLVWANLGGGYAASS